MAQKRILATTVLKDYYSTQGALETCSVTAVQSKDLRQVPFLVNDGNARMQVSIRGIISQEPQLSLYGNWYDMSTPGARLANVTTDKLERSYMCVKLAEECMPLEAIRHYEALCEKVF